jgi:hypothetical protein
MPEHANTNRRIMDRLTTWLRRSRAVGSHVVRKGRTHPAVPPLATSLAISTATGIATMAAYLALMQNAAEDIEKYRRMRTLPRKIVEIGCGGAEIARDIALGNPEIGVLATDKFDCSGPCSCGSGYRRVAMAWQNRQLAVQQQCPENLAVLRAEIDILTYLPPRSVDAVMMINPEPSVGAAVLGALAAPALYEKLKPGGRIVVLPFSREMGVTTCGGFEFDHGPDWSCGLGFIYSCPLAFQPEQGRYWGVDITASRYSLNSTQRNVYVHHVPAV